MLHARPSLGSLSASSMAPGSCPSPLHPQMCRSKLSAKNEDHGKPVRASDPGIRSSSGVETRVLYRLSTKDRASSSEGLFEIWSKGPVRSMKLAFRMRNHCLMGVTLSRMGGFICKHSRFALEHAKQNKLRWMRDGMRETHTFQISCAFLSGIQGISATDTTSSSPRSRSPIFLQGHVPSCMPELGYFRPRKRI